MCGGAARLMSRRADGGFSLLEAVAALAILGVAGVAAVAALGAELRTTEQVSRALPAVALARDRLAAIRLAPPEDLDRLPDSLAHGSFPPPFEDYRWEASARSLSDEDELFSVRVRVIWEAGDYPLETRLYRPRREVRATRRRAR